ncbi:hypothetical protein BJ912DRAFT_1055308 [Pholiota molesta]|nr:hypothetical protein BJ912DRAFT_1055308 [Pholiota molesta]
MVDNVALLTENMVVLTTAITNLTTAVHDHIRMCHGTASSTTPQTQDIDPAPAFSGLSLSSSPPSTSQTANSSDLKGNSPAVVRANLEAMTGPTNGPWYTVTVGQEPGVYQHIAQVMYLTSGISGNAYKRYTSQAAAIEAYEHAWDLNAVRRVR